MDRLGWLAVAAVMGCGPAVPTDTSASSGSSGNEDDDAETREVTTANPTTASTSTTTADPTVPSTVSTADPDASATAFPETDGQTDCLGGGGPLALGEPCVAASECASGVCRSFGDAPPDPEAECVSAPDDCSTVVTGTVLRLPPSPTGLPGVPVRILGALQAITDPLGGQAFLETMSDDAGRVEGATAGPAMAAIALIAVVGGDATYFPTGIGIANDSGTGMYPVGTDVHDLWALPVSTLAAFNTALEADPTVPADMLPLGDAGGTVGIVRDAAGSAIAGAVVQPDSGSSAAIVRYVTDGGDVDSVATQSSGVFIVLGASPTGEGFTASIDGAPIASGTAGDANGLVFALPLTS
jgi:hypothetical protein